MEDWEAVEAKMVLVEMADVLVEAIDEGQDVQDAQEDLVELVELVELEVQDHHSHHLPLDHAALAHQGRCQQVGQRRLGRLGHSHHREGGQRH